VTSRLGRFKSLAFFYSVDRFLDEFGVMRSMIWTLHIVHLSPSHAEGGRGWVLGYHPGDKLSLRSDLILEI
jgi:hypothetical protein